MSTSDALRPVRILAQAGVYQVNLGGGEPFLRSDTLDLNPTGVEAGMLMCASAAFLVGPAWRMGHLLLDPFPQVWGALPWVRDVPGEICLACLDRRCSRDCPAHNIDGERIYGLEAAVG
ncbi:MAG: hypothetical protein ACYC5Q_04985 [Thermoleophilia bacterium]